MYTSETWTQVITLNLDQTKCENFDAQLDLTRLQLQTYHAS